MKGLHELNHAARLLLVLLAALLPGDWAHAATPEITTKISRLMEASGINHSMKQVLPGLLSGFDEAQQAQPIPVNVRAALRDAATQGFQNAPMLEKVRAKMTGMLNDKQIDDTLSWLTTPLGRRITELENAASEPAAAPKIQAYTEELQKRPAPAPRMRLIQELNQAMGAQEMTNNFTEAMVLATALGVNAAQPQQQQVPADKLQKEVKANMPELYQQTEQMLTTTLLYTYVPLSDKEIETYIQFAKSASGAAYSRSAVAGVSDALLEAIARFMTAIPKAIERTKGAVGA